jgi:hypothetical protein
MKATNLKKMKQWQFEDELVRLIDDVKGISKRKHYEMSVDDDNNEQTISLWLYYNSDRHIGTWQKGDCWVFKENF